MYCNALTLLFVLCTNHVLAFDCPTSLTRDDLYLDVQGQNPNTDPAEFGKNFACGGEHLYFTNNCSLNVSNITDFKELFSNCTNRIDYSSARLWDVSKATTVYAMFRNCTTYIDLRLWDFGGLGGGADENVIDLLFDKSPEHRPHEYFNLHMLDHMPGNNLNVSKVLNSGYQYTVTNETLPCWYTQNDNDAGNVTFNACSTGSDQNCNYNPASTLCTKEYINNLTLTCSEPSLKIVETLCPHLIRQSIKGATCEKGSNCMYNCNSDVYDDDCRINLNLNESDDSIEHFELTCFNGTYKVFNSDRLVNVLDHCTSKCQLKQQSFADSAALCKKQTNCIGLQILNEGCPSDSTVKSIANVSICTEFSSASRSKPSNPSISNTCVVSYADMIKYNKIVNQSTTTSTPTATPQIINEFDFSLLPTIKSKGPIVTVSILFGIVLGTHLYLLIRR